jgi:phosphoglycolate phosphatase
VRLVLFDIDGTLIHGHGIGGRCMERAGRGLLGPEFTLSGIDFGGALDPWIFRQAAERLGHTEVSRIHPEFHERYLVELADDIARGERLPEMLPGVAEALTVLGADPTLTLGLVTGNYTRAAPLKLRAAGIDPAQFVLGAFGEEAPTRPDLVKLAMERWSARGADADPRHVVVIGDTPRDVDCAKKNGCRAVAVATGWHTLEQLEATDADVVARDLTAIGDLLRSLWAS